jgi:hypothetical protein
MCTFLATPQLSFQTGNYLLCKRSGHPTLRNSLLPRRLHNHLEKMHHLSILYPLRYLLEQQRVLNVVKAGSQIDVDDSGLLLDDGFCHAVHRFMCSSFGSISIRSRLKVSFEDRFQNEFKSSLDHTVTNRRDGQRELHLKTTSIWDGLRSVIRSIRFAVSGSRCSRRGASAASTR